MTSVLVVVAIGTALWWFCAGVGGCPAMRWRARAVLRFAVIGVVIGVAVGNAAFLWLLTFAGCAVSSWLVWRDRSHQQQLKREAELLALQQAQRAAADATRRENHELEIAQSLGGLLAKTPTQFEETVGLILGRLGFNLERVGGPGDLGADLVGTDQDGRSVVV